MARSKLPDIPEYVIWQAMKRRCDTPSVNGYARYGGRGIRVCSRWLTDFWTFYEDMGPRPGPEFSLERKDTDGDYEPNNCRWATVIEQARNRSTNHLVSYQGRQVTLAELSELTGISESTLWFRASSGFNEHRLVEPVRPLLYEVDGEKLTMKEWSERNNIAIATIRKRLKMGWDVKTAMTQNTLSPKEYQSFKERDEE